MIPSPLLVVTDRHGSKRPLAGTVKAVLDGGARWIWLRDKDLEPRSRRDLALELIGVVREAGGWLTIGGDVELAAEIDADGVHLSGAEGRLGLPDRIAAARAALGANALVGVSAHGVAEIRAAAEAGADYATLSPIFATASKPGYGPALGVGSLEAASRVPLSILALGGIGPDEAAACRAAGAAGIAVMGGVMASDDPERAVRVMLEKFF